MLKIFAKRYTNEKILILCTRNDIKQVQKRLNSKYGGDWILVDQLFMDEVLKFNDAMEYKGFENEKERYCSFIEKL